MWQAHVWCAWAPSPVAKISTTLYGYAYGLSRYERESYSERHPKGPSTDYALQ